MQGKDITEIIKQSSQSNTWLRGLCESEWLCLPTNMELPAAERESKNLGQLMKDVNRNVLVNGKSFLGRQDDLNRYASEKVIEAFRTVDNEMSDERRQARAALYEETRAGVYQKFADDVLQRELGEYYRDAYGFWGQGVIGLYPACLASFNKDEMGYIIPNIKHHHFDSLYRDSTHTVFVTSFGLLQFTIDREVKTLGIIETTYKLIPGRGYSLEEVIVSNTQMKRLCTGNDNVSIDRALLSSAEKQEQQNIKQLKKTKISKEEQGLLRHVGVENVGILFGQLYGGEIPGILEGSLRVKHREDSTFHTVMRRLDVKSLDCFQVLIIDPHIEKNSDITFYVREKDGFQHGDCVLSDAKTSTIAAGVEMLRRISSTVDISELPVEMEEGQLSAKALAWLNCQAKGIKPCQDQEGTPVKLDDLVPEGGDFEAVKEAMEAWIEKIPHETEPDRKKYGYNNVKEALDTIVTESHRLTMRAHA
jgi:hypothetical protein